MSATYLAFEGLVRGFGALPVLAGVSGRAETGELLVVSGSNGSGKSTLLRCLAGLLRAQGGHLEVREDGENLDADGRRRRVGYVAPDLAFYEALTAGENLEFFARVRGLSAERGLTILSQLGVPSSRTAGALSSGMRQRLRWAWALLHRPRILLLDEPFQNLDPPGEEAVRCLLAEHLEEGLAVVATPSPLSLPRVASHLDLTPSGRSPKEPA